MLARKFREGWYWPNAALDHAGGLADTAGDWEKYLQYLAWLAGNTSEQRKLRFDRMSRGWVLGTTEFREQLAKEHQHAAAPLEGGHSDADEARTELLARRLGRLLRALGKTEADIARDRKSAPWKIAVAVVMKTSSAATNRWLGDALRMGNPFRVSRLVSAAQIEPKAITPFLHKMAKGKT